MPTIGTKLGLVVLLAALFCPLSGQAQTTVPVVNGGTGANSLAGAWINIFSGAGIAATCTQLQNVAGVLTCTATTGAGALTNLGGAALSGATFTGDIVVPNFKNSHGTVIPSTVLGNQGPVAGYVQLAPAPSGAGCFYQDGSGTYSWFACGVADINISVASFAIPANTCYGSVGSATPATAAMTGLTTAMGVYPTYTANSSAINGWGTVGGFSLQTWASATATVSYVVCNSTSAPITGGAITFRLAAK